MKSPALLLSQLLPHMENRGCVTEGLVGPGVSSTPQEVLGQGPRKWRVAGEVGGVSFGKCSPFPHLPSFPRDVTIVKKRNICWEGEEPAFQVLRGPVMGLCSFDLRECRDLAPVVAAAGKKGPEGSHLEPQLWSLDSSPPL